MSNSYETKARIPVRPLSFDNKDLAINKELLVDYKNGSLYVKDESGNIINVGATIDSINQIIEYLKNHPELITENITVNIDGRDVELGTIIIDHDNTILDLVENLEDIMNSIPVISTDLNTPGQVADSKIVGDAINAIKKDLEDHSNTNATQSTSGHMSKEDKEKLDSLDKITVDDALSQTSTNPVQNKVIYEELNNHTHQYIPLSGGDINGGLAIPNNASIDGKYNGDNVIIVYVGDDGKIHIGSSINSSVKIKIEHSMILPEDSYGTELPDTGEEGQLFFKLID